jgi:hypothetical protein
VDGAGDTVLKLEVHFGDSVFGENRSIRDVTYPWSVSQQADVFQLAKLTNGRRLNHVTDCKALDCLVLGRATTAVGASDGVDVAAALLVATVGLSLLDHFGDDGFGLGGARWSWSWWSRCERIKYGIVCGVGGARFFRKSYLMGISLWNQDRMYASAYS